MAAPRPVLAVTCGDPAGIGPELVLRALPALRRVCRPLLVGEPSVWRRAGWRPGTSELFSTGLGGPAPAFGRVSARAGELSFASLKTALGLVGRGLARGLLTAPISKKAWALAGLPYRDHTEYFREQAAVPVEMVLGAPARGLWCVLATRHVPLAQASSRLSAAGVARAAAALSGALRRLGLKRPRLALCGFNPHAGEDGLLGREERLVLAPGAARARRAGVDLAGPLAADTAWREHAQGRFDGLVALYHDQALIPLKTAAGLSIVNWTVGLPFPRTSPGHGTGFDIAGRGLADPAATIAAGRLAARLCGPLSA